MSNEYYNRTSQFAPRTKARSDNVRDELDAVALGFDKLPTPEDITSGRFSFGTSSGTATAYSLTIPSTFEAYLVGQPVTFLAHIANTGTASLNVNGKGVVPLTRQDGTPLRAGDIPLNGIMYAVYNGSQFRLATSTAIMVLNAEAAQNAAQASQQAAATSETNALASQNAAATSAANALTSEQNASASEGIASTAATTATGARDVTLTARDTTLGYRDTANTAATNALTSENAASVSASNASTSETNAGLSATASSNSASAASTSETNAGLSAAAALTSEQNAKLSEDEAEYWALQAAQIVTDGVIDDAGTSTIKTWSSQKIDSEFNTRTILNTPSITSPASGTIDYLGAVTSSTYSTSDNYTGILDNVIWEVALDSAFTNIIDTGTGSTDLTYTPNIGLPLTEVFVRVRHESDGHLSNWSETVSYTTRSIHIEAPTVSVEGGVVDVQENPTFIGSAFSVFAGTDTHTETVVTVKQAGTVVHTATITTGDLTRYTLPREILEVSTEYTAEMRYRGAVYGLSQPSPTTFTTVYLFFPTNDNSDVDGLDYFAMDTAGNLDTTTDTGYFGEIPATDLIDDYDYRGEYLNDYSYKIGQVVIMNTGDLVRYVSLVNSNLGNDPTSSPTQWALDEREFLPTGRWLYHQMGFGEGTLTPTGILQHSGNTGSDAGWLKFYSHGKVLYIAKKPFANNINWNAIAARDAVYGNRTIRIGTKLYKVRLMTGANADPVMGVINNNNDNTSCTKDHGGGSEWNELIYRIHNDVPACAALSYDGGPQVGTNWANFTDADIVVGGGDNGRNSWTQETDNNETSRRVQRGTNRLSFLLTYTSSEAFVAFGWRPVLELITEDSPEYPTQGKTYTEGVGEQTLTNYDFYTDTGYFGEVSSNDLFTGATLASDIGLTTGTSINSTDGWLKFYWHGQILYIAKKPFRHTVSWEDIYNRGAVWGIKNSNGVFGLGTNVGGTIDQGRTVTKDTDVYKVRLFRGAKNSDVNLATTTADQENGGYSEWNELIYRIHQDTPRSDSGLTTDGGGQIGNNWANFTDADMVISFESGDGSISWSMERPGSSIQNRVYRGTSRLSFLGTTSSSNTSVNFGWRPVLILDS